MRLQTVQSFFTPMLTGSGVMVLLSALQKWAVGYPMYPGSFVVPVLAGAFGGCFYQLRWLQQKKHHRYMEMQNHRLETILETVQSGIIMINAKTSTIESINPTAQLLFGYSEEEIVGKKCFHYLCDMLPDSCPIQKQDISVDIVEQTLIKKTGINIIRKARKVEIKGHTHIVISIMDITPLVETEKKLREANERVRIADRLKTEFLTNVGHEIRTPLNAIIGISDLLIGQDVSEEFYEDLQLIRNSGKSLLKTMENIMDYAMLKSGNFVLQKNFFDLYETILFTSEIYRTRVVNKNLTIEINIAECMDKPFFGDKIVIEKIIASLLDNAIKFTPSGTITLTCQLTETNLHLQVSDTGVGIPEEQQDYIFDAFYQVDGTITRQYEGTGMGLAIVEFFVTKMEGTIRVTSRVDMGTTFYINLPVKQTCT